MGNGGSSAGVGWTGSSTPTYFTSTNNNAINQVFQQLQQQMTDPTPATPPVNVDVTNTLTDMTDDELASLVQIAKKVDMPNHIGDVDDITQRFVYAAGLNEKPEKLSASEFQQYLSDNNIPRSQILSRSINGNTMTVRGTQINMSSQMIKAQFTDGKYNYIGGKYGGQMLGAGTYFDMNGGHQTSYGGDTMNAVLSKSAHVINESTLKTKARSFAQSHPKFARAVGAYSGSSWGGSNNNMSIYALVMGYNVIQSGTYYNIIDRRAVVVRG